jgi:hypothetical protein
VGDTTSATGSFDVVVLGNEVLGLPGFPRAPLLPAGGKWQGGGGRVGMLAGCDHALATTGNTCHGWLGYYETGPG